MTSTDAQKKPAPVYTKAHTALWPVMMLFILAYVEAVCFLGLFQTLTGYISGATILLATEFFREDAKFMTKVLVLVAFVPSTFFWVILKEHLCGWRYFVKMLFLIEAALLTGYMAFAMHVSPLGGVDAPETMLIVAISVFAMSLHNVHSLQVMPEKAQIAITGLFANFAGSTVHLCALLRTGQQTTDAALAFRKLLYPLLAFFGGAFLGALGYSSLGFVALACPIVLLIMMAILSTGADR